MTTASDQAIRGTRPAQGHSAAVLKTLSAAASIGALLSAGGCSGDQEPKPIEFPVTAVSSQSKATRLLHWNVFGLNETPFSNEEGNLENFERGQEIGQWIKAGNYDIVSIAEGTSPTMRAGIIKAIGDKYPNYIEEMDGTTDLAASGLMLFSTASYTVAPRTSLESFVSSVLKTPLSKQACDALLAQTTPPNVTNENSCFTYEYPAYTCAPPHLYEFNIEGTFPGCSAAFSWFPSSECANNDCHSGKGVGWVRLLNPRNGNRPLNVVFSHTQADYPEDGQLYATYRKLQLERIYGMMFGTERYAYKVPVLSADEDVILSGDLNIPGDLDQGDLGEYQTFSDSLLPHGVTDSFRSQTSKDPGYTRSAENDHDDIDPYPQRLDYIFTGFPTVKPNKEQAFTQCVYHTRVIKNFVVKGLFSWGAKGVDLSDHFPVETTFGPSYDHCSPQTALDNPKSGSHSLALPKEGLGGPIWVRIDNPGTYSFDTLGATTGYLIEGFAIDDISEPLVPWTDTSVTDANNPETMIKFDMAKPFFLKITPRDLEFTGNFSLVIKRHNGDGFDNAIVVRNDVKLKENMLAHLSDNNAAPMERMYFELFTDRLSNDEKAAFNFKACALDAADNIIKNGDQFTWIGLEVWTAGKVKKLDTQIAPTPGESCTHIADSSSFDSVATTYYLVVKRNPVTQPQRIEVGWSNDIRTFLFQGLKVVEQQDLTGDDNPVVETLLAGQDSHLVYDLGEMDTGASAGAGTLPAEQFGAGTNLNRYNFRIGSQFEIRVFDKDDEYDFGQSCGTTCDTDELMGHLDNLSSQYADGNIHKWQLAYSGSGGWPGKWYLRFAITRARRQNDYPVGVAP